MHFLTGFLLVGLLVTVTLAQRDIEEQKGNRGRNEGQEWNRGGNEGQEWSRGGNEGHERNRGRNEKQEWNWDGNEGRDWENEKINGNRERDAVTPPCLRRHDGCRNVNDGDYQLCVGCLSGGYIRCENGSREWRQCPQITPADASDDLKFQLVFDPVNQSCASSSESCYAGTNNNQENDEVDDKGFPKGLIDFLRNRNRERLPKKIGVFPPGPVSKGRPHTLNEVSVDPPFLVDQPFWVRGKQDGGDVREQGGDAAGEQGGDAAGEQDGNAV